MKLKYAGPKPIISHTGITFDNNKEDKFIYTGIVLQLLKALSHTYHDDKKYVYNTDNKVLSDDDLLMEVKKYCPDIRTLIESRSNTIEEEVGHQLQRAHDSCVLGEDCKEVLENNINIMHDYLVQRSVNKVVYYCLINALAKLLLEDHIDYVTVPMLQNYFHVLHSVQGSLKLQKAPVETKLEIYKDKGELFAELKVINQ